MGHCRFTVLAAYLLVVFFSFCFAQSPIALENFCKEEGLTDNLSCEKADGSVECFLEVSFVTKAHSVRTDWMKGCLKLD